LEGLTEAIDMADAEDRIAALLAAQWVKIRPLLEERMAALEKAAAAARADTLADDLRKEAGSSAHKLAGSLGMYGYDEGTRVARELEMLLNKATPDAAKLNGLIAELRATVFPAA
jgi:HPt (histidine-containing phosphotransfer) domain-containing protein